MTVTVARIGDSSHSIYPMISGPSHRTWDLRARVPTRRRCTGELR
jgi:hypothetical protein